MWEAMAAFACVLTTVIVAMRSIFLVRFEVEALKAKVEDLESGKSDLKIVDLRFAQLQRSIEDMTKHSDERFLELRSLLTERRRQTFLGGEPR